MGVPMERPSFTTTSFQGACGHLHGDAFFHHDIIPECLCESIVLVGKYTGGSREVGSMGVQRSNVEIRRGPQLKPVCSIQL